MTLDSLRYDLAAMPALWVVVGLAVAAVVAIIAQSIIAVSPSAPRQARTVGRVVWKGPAGLIVLLVLLAALVWERI